MSRVSTFYEPIQLINRSTPSTPATDRAKLYLKSNVLTYLKSTGVEVSLDPVTNGDHLYLADKDATTVAFGFTNASGTGFFRSTSAGYIGFSVDGTERANLSTSGLTLAGNLTVNGTMTTVDSTVVNIADNVVVVNSGQAYLDGGYAVKRDLTSLTSDTPFESGTCQVGSSGLTIVLSSGASVVDSYYNNMYVKTTGGTGSGQTRLITAYVGATQTATVSVVWDTIPDDTTTYSIYNNVYVASVFHESSKEMQYLYLTSQASSSFTGTFADARFSKLTLDNKLAVAAGSTSLPSIKVGSTESGLSYGTSALRVSVGGAEVANYAASTFNVLTDLAVAGKTIMSSGTVALPSLYFGPDTTTGLYRIGADQIGVSVSAAKILDISSSSFAVTSSAGRLAFSVENDLGNALVTGTLGVSGSITSSGQLLLVSGSATAPEITFLDDTDTGIYRPGSNELALALGGKDTLKLSISTSGGAIMRQCESSSGHVCDYNYVRLGEVAAVSTPAAVPLAVINVPDGGKCAVVIDAYEIDANNAYEALSTTHVVYASGTTVTDSPVFSVAEDATWTLTTGNNTLTLNLLPNDSDTNNYTKYFNVKIRLQPMNNTACTIVDA